MGAWGVPLPLHDAVHDGTKNTFEGTVVQSFLQGHVQGIPRALAVANLVGVAGAGKEIPVLVERQRHHPVRTVKRFLHTVPVMNVDVDVQHSLVAFQQFNATQHNVVDVAEPTGFSLFGVVHAPRPIDHHVGLAFVDAAGTAQRPTAVNGAVLVQIVKHGAIVLAHVELAHLRGKLTNVVHVDEF